MDPEEQRTSWTAPAGTVKDGVSCTACGRTYEACTKQLFGSPGKPCCGTCGYTDTHAERTVMISMDPATTVPMPGDTVLYEDVNEAVYGGVVEESYTLGPQALQHFRIRGHEGLFSHTPDPAWKERRILRRPGVKKAAEATPEPPAGTTLELVTNEQLLATMVKLGRRLVTNFEAEPANLHQGCNASVDRLERQLERVKEELATTKEILFTIRRPVDRGALAKRLCVAWMMANYHGVHEQGAGELWDAAQPNARGNWRAVVDVAVQQLLATDIEPS